MRRTLLLTAILALTVGCAARSIPTAPPAPGLTELPSPSALAKLASPRSTSGSHASLNRTLVSYGSTFESAVGLSANAVNSGAGTAVISGTTSELNYVFYKVANTMVDSTRRFSEVQLDYIWEGADPPAPQGLYLGIPDLPNDRWVWLDAAEAHAKWLDLTALDLGGAGTGGPDTFFALVKHADAVATVDQFALRFTSDGSVTGDEWVYYSSFVSGVGFSISRVPLSGGASEVVHAAAAPVSYGFPYIVQYHGAWALTYTRFVSGEKSQVWMSEPGGSAPWMVVATSTEHVFSAGWDYNSDRGLYMQTNSGVLSLHAFHDSFEFGRLSNTTSNVDKAVWDIGNDLGFSGYKAIASVEFDTVNNYNHLAVFTGNPPFDIDAEPVSLFTRLPDEDARDPEMVELADLSGDPELWVYSANRNRDDASFNIYRIPSTGTLGGAQPILVDAAYELRYPTPSRDGRYLAFMLQPAGSDPTVLYDIVVVDLLHPGDPGVVLASDCRAQLSWYDPTP